MRDLQSAANQVCLLIQNLTRDAGFNLHLTIRTSPEAPNLRVVFEGPDSSLLAEHDGALLTAIRHIVIEALGVPVEEQNRILFDLLDDEADLQWEFRRTASSIARGLIPVATRASAFHQPIKLATRQNQSCISVELWDRIVSYRIHDGPTVN